MDILTRMITLTVLFGTAVSVKHIRWRTDGPPCILIDIDANNKLEWIDQDGNITVADNFSFDDVDVTEGSCVLPHPTVSGLWPDGKQFEIVFYNNSGRATVQMDMMYDPKEVFKKLNLTDKVRNIVSFDAGKLGMAYRCNTPTSLVTTVYVGKEAYRYSFEITSIELQGFGIDGGNFSAVEECQADMTSKHTSSSTPASKSTHSIPTTKTSHSTPKSTHSMPTTKTSHSTPKSTHPSSHSSSISTKPSTHTTKATTHSTKVSTHSTKPTTHSTKPTTHSTKPTTHSTKPTTHSTKPTTHSSNPSTHSTRPTSPPIPSEHSKPLKQNFGTACMRMVGEFQFNVSYPSSTPGKNLTALFGVNDIDKIVGSCGNTTLNILYVTFYNNWQMNITVKRENGILGSLEGRDKNMFWWSNLYLQYFYNTTAADKKSWFPNINATIANKTVIISKAIRKKTFEASLSGSYLCNALTTVDLGEGNSLNIQNLQYTAFQPSANISFSDNNVTECPADSTTKGNTYIYVGVGLAVVVALVMTIYIAGRCCYRKKYEEL